MQQKLGAVYSHANRLVDEDDRPIIAAFRRHFYYDSYSVLEDFEQHPLVSKLMEACAMIIEGSRSHTEDLITKALALYAEALAALQRAIQNPDKAKEDATLVATILLCNFEVRTANRF